MPIIFVLYRFYLHITYEILTILTIKRDIDQLDLKIDFLHFVNINFHSFELLKLSARYNLA